MFFKKKTYKDFVDTGIGRVYIKPITNKIFNNALVVSTSKGNSVNNAIFFSYCEKKMISLPFWKWNSMSIADNDLIRNKLREVLLRDKILVENKKEEIIEDKADIFSKADEDIFNAQKERMFAKHHLRNF